MSSTARRVPQGYANIGLVNAQKILVNTVPLAAIATSGLASDIKSTGGPLPASSVPPLDASIIATGTIANARLPAGVQSAGSVTDVWTGFNQHQLSGTNTNPLGVGGFVGWGRDSTGKTAFANTPGSSQAGGWEFVAYATNGSFQKVVATLSTGGTLQLPAINNGGNGLAVADTIVMGGHGITGVNALGNSGSGISIPENLALGGCGITAISSLSNSGSGITVPENITLNSHSLLVSIGLQMVAAGLQYLKTLHFPETRFQGCRH